MDFMKEICVGIGTFIFEAWVNPVFGFRNLKVALDGSIGKG